MEPATLMSSETDARQDYHIGPSVASGDVDGSGEDGWGLWQINVEPAREDPDVFDCSELVQWAASPMPGGTEVAMETLTIAHEGLVLV